LSATAASNGSARQRLSELHALVLQAWELRDTPYLRDACEAIGEWHERQPLTKLEAEQAFEAAYTALKAAYFDRYGARGE
jgi:hypothetical protein